MFIPLTVGALFEPHAVETAQLLEREALRKAVESAVTNAATSFTATVASRNAPRVELTASKTLPALTGDAAILKQKPLIAAKTLPAFTGAVTLSSRQSDRNVITAARTFPAQASTVTRVLERSPQRKSLTAAVTYMAPHFSAVLVKFIELTAAKTFPALTGAADVNTVAVNRYRIDPDRLLRAPPTYTALLRQRESARHAVTAAKTLPAIASTAAVGKEIPLEAAKTHAAASYAAALNTRAVLRHEIELTPLTYVVFTATLTIDQRIAQRHVLAADKTFGVIASTAALGKRIDIEADTTYAAAASTVALLTRAVVRHEVQLAGPTYGASVYTVFMRQRLADRLPVQADTAFEKLLATAAVQKRLPLLADKTHAAITTTLTLSSMESARTELEFRQPAQFGFDGAGFGFDQAPFAPVIPIVGGRPPITSLADVLQRIANRYIVRAGAFYAAPTFTAALGKRIPVARQPRLWPVIRIGCGQCPRPLCAMPLKHPPLCPLLRLRWTYSNERRPDTPLLRPDRSCRSRHSASQQR